MGLENKTALVLLVSDGTKIPPIWEYTKTPYSKAKIHCVISNKAEPKYFPFAKERGLLTATIPWRKDLGEPRATYSGRLGEYIRCSFGGKLENYLILSAGQPYFLTEEFLRIFDPLRIVNFHPGLLPDNPDDLEVTVATGEKIPAIKGVYDHRIIQEILRRRHPWAGISFHYMTRDIDTGDLIARGEVPVLTNDTFQSLSYRIYDKENEMIPAVLDKVISRISDLK